MTFFGTIDVCPIEGVFLDSVEVGIGTWRVDLWMRIGILHAWLFCLVCINKTIVRALLPGVFFVSTRLVFRIPSCLDESVLVEKS